MALEAALGRASSKCTTQAQKKERTDAHEEYGDHAPGGEVDADRVTELLRVAERGQDAAGRDEDRGVGHPEGAV